MDFIIKYSNKELTERRKEAYSKYCKIIQWGRRSPVRYCERFYGIEFLDHQKYTFMNSWITPRNVWCASRASGKTTLLAPFTMASANLYPKYQAYIMAGVGSQSQEAFLKIEKIAKKEIASFTGLTDFFLGEIEHRSGEDGFNHYPSSFSFKLYNDSRVNSLNSVVDNIRSKRSNLNIYDESGFASEDLFTATMPFITQDTNFMLGGDIDLSLMPDQIPNKAIFASSASDMTTYFYKVYKEYSKRMLLGDTDYFVADINAEIIFNATYNGKLYPVSLLSKKQVEEELSKNKEKALREYYNKFSSDGGSKQPYKRTVIKKNSEVRAPELRGLGDKRYVFAYDPARQFDNSVVLVAELINDAEHGYRMKIVNGLSFVDIFKKTKTQLRYPEQIKHLKKMLLDYNGHGKLDYENIERVLIDSGSGGGGRFIADDLMDDWRDNNGIKHKGLIDPIEHREYISKFPNALEKVSLLSPKKYKVQMFDAMIDMLNLDLISFTEDYDGKGHIMLYEDKIAEYNDDGKIKSQLIREMYEYKLSFEEELALINIDLLKEEIVNIWRYDGINGNYRYDLSEEQANKMHDDRAYCLAMLSWYLQQLRRGQILNKKQSKSDLSQIPACVSAASF